MRRIVVVLAAASGMATAAPVRDCASVVQWDSFESVLARLKDEGEAFQQAFAAVQDSEPVKPAAIAASLVGASMTNEAAATIEGLAPLLELRDEFYPGAGRDAVLARTRSGLAAGGKRLHKLAQAYQGVQAMTEVMELQQRAERVRRMLRETARDLLCAP